MIVLPGSDGVVLLAAQSQDARITSEVCYTVLLQSTITALVILTGVWLISERSQVRVG